MIKLESIWGEDKVEDKVEVKKVPGQPTGKIVPTEVSSDDNGDDELSLF